jgi:CO/xanthine dehydrogenase Mo-binding subunit
MTRHNAMPEPFVLPARGVYAARSIKLDVESAYVDMVANTFMRAPGESVGTFALESAVDELAVELGMDPIELRLRNEPNKDPTENLPFSSRHLVEAYRTGAERFSWNKRHARPGTQRELVTQLLKLAADDSLLTGLKTDEVHALNGGLGKVDEPARWESYPVILGGAGRDELTVEASAPPPFETMHWSMHSYGAMFCEVRVNAVTGETRVSRFLGSFDCGRILNAKTARSQFRGGIVMGLGLALMEETEFDERNGRIMNPSLALFTTPRANACAICRLRLIS